MSETETQATEPTEAKEQKPGLRKTRQGIVVSDKMDKTIVVEYIRRVAHPRFQKIIKTSKKYYAHDAKSEAKVGDKVRIEETRPLSKLKRWRLLEILKH